MGHDNFGQRKRKKLLLTKEGLDKLRKRLDEITARRHRAIKELRSIDKDDVDELDMSVQLQNLESTEIEATELNDLLQHVEPVIKQKTPELVTVGCTVELKSMGASVLYTIVCPIELDIENNKISEESVLGKAVLGKRAGESFSIITPKGDTISYQVVSIK